MKKTMSFLPLLLLAYNCLGQTNLYEISFENAVHHEAVIKAQFPDISSDTLAIRMSRTSPGRYALHEFAKNVYKLKAKNSKGEELKVHRPNPYEWLITGHDGTVNISYTLFANRGDGTYSQVDETHAHLNMPATFMYAPQLSDRKIEIAFNVREDLNWNVATQLPLVSGTLYSAPNLQYFMDSPTEISNHSVREFEVDSKKIQFILHHNGTDQEFDSYFEYVKKVVLTEKEVYGELPQFDYGIYTFLACYIPNASGDGMEHRNSTVLTSTQSLSDGGMYGNIGTVSHEFFHAWNVERIRPRSLEPFDFEAADMSGALWFAEGFTSYYTYLILCRAGIFTPEQFIEGWTGTFNYVWNSPAHQFFNPIEMSYQAPFVDAATSVEPVNRKNTFISYYSYGSSLGLAMDLSLRQQGLTLDGYMKLIWNTYGKKEIPYTLENLHEQLNQYAGADFGNHFFNSFIYDSKMPQYSSLFTSVGVNLNQDLSNPFFGVEVTVNEDGSILIEENTSIDSPAYIAGLESGDVITGINALTLSKEQNFTNFIKQFKVGDTLKVDFLRYGEEKTTSVILGSNPHYSLTLSEKEGSKPSIKVLKRRNAWLNKK
jgi:predicted metalloprotease with PDZ domain